jgi:hypothetical protein
MNIPHPDPRSITFTNCEDRPDTHGFSPLGEAAASASTRWETGRVWEDAGITPPRCARLVVELLHRQAMGEEAWVVRLARSLAEVPCEEARYRVADPARLGLTARDFGIPTAGRCDEAIARDVASAVIDEYAAAHHLCTTER